MRVRDCPADRADVHRLHDPQADVGGRDPVAQHRVGRAGLHEVDQCPHLALEPGLEGQHGGAPALVAEGAHDHAPATVDLADDQVLAGAGVTEEDLGELRPAGHVPDRPDLDTGLVAGHEKHRDPPVLGGVRVGAAQDVEPVGVPAERRPYLLAVDHPFVAVEFGAGAQAGQVAAGVGLAEALPPELLDLCDLREEAGLLLGGAEREQGRPEQVTAVDSHPVRRLCPGVLDLEDDLLGQRPPAAAVLDRPGDVQPLVLREELLPLPAKLPGGVVRRAADTQDAPEVTGEMIGQP